MRADGAGWVGQLEAQVIHDGANVRLQSVWTLAGIDAPAARLAVRDALNDDEATIRQAAAHAAGLWRDAGALDPLLKLVLGKDRAVARAAAEAVGRIGDKRAVPGLLQAMEQFGDWAPDASGAQPIQPPESASMR